ncbi:glycosyltransferase family 1 protein [Anaeromyxobacter sp. PSR-1]|uniref:glycosyltransferase family 4 protein n=1 Tax=Anaeromyxobacter sp. PSR-1 TaxID=1300915 RepID=UPI0005E061F8|nr:glycosyltransferase family 1 protein [Anaeromyxobacter sp. PSR-1]GAO02282.1 protein RfbU [Anaeromyxobacter sp. PSR-1]
MRFAVSLLSFRPGRVGGTETYLRELLRHVAAAAGDDRVTLVGSAAGLASIDAPGTDQVEVAETDAALVSARLAEAFTPWRARAIERAFARLDADAVLFPQQSIFPARSGVRAVVTVHDLLHVTHPEQISPLDRAFRARVYARSLKSAAGIIAISGVTRRELLQRCQVDPAIVAVVPHGARPAPLQRPQAWAGATGPYLYYPAATWPHKAHATLFRSYAALRKAGRLRERLVLTGQQTAHWRALARLARALGIADDVVHLGFVPPAHVEAIYVGARAVVFPSMHEGFGLPVLEAARLGVSVVTSRLEVFEEIGVPEALRIDFEDPEQLAAALEAGPLPLTRVPATWFEVAGMTVHQMRDAAKRALPRVTSW